MKVQTRALLPAAPDQVWPLLCASRMTGHGSPLFRFGVPKPEECRLPSGTGGVGAARQCVSDRGTIQQRITTWQPPTLLRFEMQDTDLYFGRCIDTIQERFDLVAEGNGTRVTRTTTFHVQGVLGRIKAIPVAIGLRSVHRYVYGNWTRILQDQGRP